MMSTIEQQGHEIAWDGVTVWVNHGGDGMNIARFGRGGIDIHRPFAEQLTTGRACLACSPGADWEEFRRLVFHFYGVDVPAVARPTWLDP